MSSSLHVQPTATSRLTANSASAAAAAAAARAQDDFTAAPDEVEYDAFLQKETERVIKEEAELIEEARRDNERKSTDSAFQGALKAIDKAIDSAQLYSKRMEVASGLKFRDEDLGITTQPEHFNGHLRDYQLKGFQWIVRRAFAGESIILADEMGLGKTIQVIAFLLWQRKSMPDVVNPVLVIAPLSCVGNWVSEITRFTNGELSVIRYHGPPEERSEIRDKYLSRGAKTPIFVMSYDLALRDEAYLADFKWRTLIIDEGHKLKNENSVIRGVLKRYSRDGITGAQTKLLLTGTPVQNDMIELWSLCNFIMPTVFANKDDFKKIYTFMGIGTSAAAEYIFSQEKKNAIVTKLHKLLSRYLLRRTKSEVNLCLPPKVEVLVYTPLLMEQTRILRGLLDDSVGPALAALQWVTRDGSSDTVVVSTNNRTMNLRKVCNHPFLFAEPGDAAPGSTDSRIITSSGKMVVLDKMLRELRARGHKVLIFSQFVSVLNLLADYLDFAGASAVGEYRMLTGESASEDRDMSIKEFENDDANRIGVFLLSTRAGGLGINLTAADTVIFFDSDWNPKSDEQAQDRAHRIGQTRPVVVYRLVTEGASVERRMQRIATGKGVLGRVVLQDGAYMVAGDVAGGSARGGASGVAGSTVVADEASENLGYGKCSEKLLAYWLRMGEAASTTGEAPAAGISDAELSMILDRARALQAGRRVADTVEAGLFAGSPGAASPSASTLAEPSPFAATSSVEDGGALSVVSGHGGGGAMPSSPKRARTAAADGGGATVSAATDDTVLTVVKRDRTRGMGPTRADIEQWLRVAARAEFTPSKGAGYEFVYHLASGGIVAGGGGKTSRDEVDVDAAEGGSADTVAGAGAGAGAVLSLTVAQFKAQQEAAVEAQEAAKKAAVAAENVAAAERKRIAKLQKTAAGAAVGAGASGTAGASRRGALSRTAPAAAASPAQPEVKDVPADAAPPTLAENPASARKSPRRD